MEAPSTPVAPAAATAKVTTNDYASGYQATEHFIRAVEKKKDFLPSQSIVLNSALFQRRSTAQG